MAAVTHADYLDALSASLPSRNRATRAMLRAERRDYYTFGVLAVFAVVFIVANILTWSAA